MKRDAGTTACCGRAAGGGSTGAAPLECTSDVLVSAQAAQTAHAIRTA
jgi:hypothetical protein